MRYGHGSGGGLACNLCGDHALVRGPAKAGGGVLNKQAAGGPYAFLERAQLEDLFAALRVPGQEIYLICLL